MPLALALALAAGLHPLAGLFSAAVHAVVTALASPTSTHVPRLVGTVSPSAAIVAAPVVADLGPEACFLAVAMAGLMQCAASFSGATRAVRFALARPIALGIALGVAFTLGVAQLENVQVADINGVMHFGRDSAVQLAGTTALLTLVLPSLLPSTVSRIVPAPFAALAIVSLCANAFGAECRVLGDIAMLSGGSWSWPPRLPSVALVDILNALPYAMAIALASAVETSTCETRVMSIASPLPPSQTTDAEEQSPARSGDVWIVSSPTTSSVPTAAVSASASATATTATGSTSSSPSFSSISSWIVVERALLTSGISNVAAGLFGGLAGAPSASSTYRAALLGSRGTLCGLVTAVSIICACAFVAPMLELVPLGCVAGSLVGAALVSAPATNVFPPIDSTSSSTSTGEMGLDHALPAAKLAEVPLWRRMPALQTLTEVSRFRGGDATTFAVALVGTAVGNAATGFVAGLCAAAISRCAVEASSLHVEAKRDPNNSVVNRYVASGSLFFGTVDELKRNVQPHKSLVAREVLIDMHECRVLDVSGAAALSDIGEHFSREGKILRVANLREEDRRVLVAFSETAWVQES